MEFQGFKRKLGPQIHKLNFLPLVF